MYPAKPVIAGAAGPETDESSAAAAQGRTTVAKATIAVGKAVVEPGELGEAAAAARLESIIHDYKGVLDERTKLHLGYPYNLDFDYGPLAPLQQYSINNLGDPWIESNYGVHAREFEVGVLDWFARLWHIANDKYVYTHASAARSFVPRSRPPPVLSPGTGGT